MNHQLTRGLSIYTSGIVGLEGNPLFDRVMLSLQQTKQLKWAKAAIRA